MAAPKIPREKIPWFPTVDSEACIHDRECMDFCKNNVFDWNDLKSEPIVARPYQCIIGCDACMRICPSEAIHFPSKQDLRGIMRDLISLAYTERADPEAGPAPRR